MGLTVNSIASDDADFLSLTVPTAWTAVNTAPTVITNAVYVSLYGTTNYTTFKPHGLTTGQTVAVTGITPSSFNRTATITVINSTTFFFSLFNGSTGGAYVSGGIVTGPSLSYYAETLSVDLNENKNLGSGSLKLTPTSLSSEVRFNYDLASLTAITTADFIGDKAESYVWIRATKNITITPTITLTRVMVGTPQAEDIITGTGSLVNITSGEWYLVRTDPVSIPVSPANAHYHISLTYDISCPSPNTTTVYLNKPTVYNQLALLRNLYLMDVWGTLPQIFKDRDLETPLPSYPILRLMEIGMAVHGIVYDLARGFQYNDISEGKDVTDVETLSLLTDPLRVPREYMPWLAQFTGTKLLNPVSGATPWANLPETWQGIDEIDSTVDVNDSVAWGELQGFAPEIAGLDEFFQWQIETGYYGYSAGSMAAIREATKRVLTGTKTCTITKRYTGSPWKVRIQTKYSETPDADVTMVGDSIGEMLELMEPARPLGVSLTHEIIA